MNKTISKKYGIIFLCLGAISALTALVTFFVPIFKIDIGIASASETAMNYFIFNKEAESEVIESTALRVIYGFLSWCTLYVPGYYLFYCRKISSSLGKEKFNEDIYDTMYMGLFTNSALYILTLFILFYYHEWDIWSVITGETLVKTDLHITFFIQLAVFIVSIFFKNHWNMVLNGRQQPLFDNATGYAERSAESETVELLQKYKNLCDNQVITEEEFLKKKSELLNNSFPDSGLAKIGVSDESGNADLIAKYKQLYDNGIITQEEYTEKKNELLNGVKK